MEHGTLIAHRTRQTQVDPFKAYWSKMRYIDMFELQMRKKPTDRTAKDTTHFLNVDLDIHSKSNLQPLVTAMGQKVAVLFVGRIKRTYQAHLELRESGLSESADSIIRGFCALIRKLPKAGVELWNGAKVRDFNIGVQAAMQPHSHEIALEPETVRAAAEVNARIVLTVYAPEQGKSGRGT